MTFVNEAVKCSVCSHSSTQSFITSVYVSDAGYMDLDTRRHNYPSGYTDNKLQECPFCHHCAEDISEKVSDEVKLKIDSEAYKKLAKNDSVNATAKKFLLKAILSKSEKDIKKAGFMYLSAAWKFDDLDDVESAGKARIKAIDCFKTHLDKENDIDLAVTVVDLLRRISEFKEAITTADFVLEYADSDMLRKILAYEKDLAKNQDSRCHNLGEVIS